jgi:hypothetical protein
MKNPTYNVRSNHAAFSPRITSSKSAVAMQVFINYCASPKPTGVGSLNFGEKPLWGVG